jgi:DNA-binding FadR family transcriptional regulator
MTWLQQHPAGQLPVAGALTVDKPRQTRGVRSAGHDEIVEILGSEILSGSRAPGSRMPTADELQERFGASRVLMREVTKTLVAKGMVTAKSRVGTHVLASEYWNWFDPDVLSWRVGLGLDNELFVHLGQLRRAVEPAAAAAAADHRTDDDVAAMRRALTGMASATDRRAFSAGDLQFHIAVAAASGNPLFRSFTSVVETALGAYLSVSTPMDEGVMAISVKQHTRIADAIEARDATEASLRMQEVIDVGLERVVEPRR